MRYVADETDAQIGHPADGKLVQQGAWFIARPISPLEKLQSLDFGAFFPQFAPTSLLNSSGELTHLGAVYRIMMLGDGQN